jgi:hypothetical protein
MNVFETRQQVEAEQAAEGKRNFALPMAIDVLLFDGHAWRSTPSIMAAASDDK